VEGSHEAYLQAKDLDVWRVTDEGMKNGTKTEKQIDVIAKSIILSSLDEDHVWFEDRWMVAPWCDE
jgi:hypothetical protein